MLPESDMTALTESKTAHFRALESLYLATPVNRILESHMAIPEVGLCRITFNVDEALYHAAGAVV
jgi:hypothetical protein